MTCLPGGQGSARRVQGRIPWRLTVFSVADVWSSPSYFRQEHNLEKKVKATNDVCLLPDFPAYWPCWQVRGCTSALCSICPCRLWLSMSYVIQCINAVLIKLAFLLAHHIASSGRSSGDWSPRLHFNFTIHSPSTENNNNKDPIFHTSPYINSKTVNRICCLRLSVPLMYKCPKLWRWYKFLQRSVGASFTNGASVWNTAKAREVGGQTITWILWHVY